MPRVRSVRGGSAASVVERPATGARRQARDWDTMAQLPEGAFLMGSEERLAYPDDGEGPVRRVRVSAFRMDRLAVTNADFRRFVDESGYVTEAERIGWSLVFVGTSPGRGPTGSWRRPSSVVASGRGGRLAPPGGTGLER